MGGVRRVLGGSGQSVAERDYADLYSFVVVSCLVQTAMRGLHSMTEVDYERFRNGLTAQGEHAHKTG